MNVYNHHLTSINVYIQTPIYKLRILIPLNLKSSNEWAFHNRHNWMESGNSNSDEKVLKDLLSCPYAEVVCKWLCLFVQETQKENGK